MFALFFQVSPMVFLSLFFHLVSCSINVCGLSPRYRSPRFPTNINSNGSVIQIVANCVIEGAWSAKYRTQAKRLT